MKTGVIYQESGPRWPVGALGVGAKKGKRNWTRAQEFYSERRTWPNSVSKFPNCFRLSGELGICKHFLGEISSLACLEALAAWGHTFKAKKWLLAVQSSGTEKSGGGEMSHKNTKVNFRGFQLIANFVYSSMSVFHFATRHKLRGQNPTQEDSAPGKETSAAGGIGYTM